MCAHTCHSTHLLGGRGRGKETGDLNFPPSRERPPLPPADARQRPPSLRCSPSKLPPIVASPTVPPHCHLLVRDHPWFREPRPTVS